MQIQIDALKSKIKGFNYGTNYALFPTLNLKDVTNDYRQIAGDLEDNYIVAGAINFMYRKMQEVTLALQEEVKIGKWVNYEGPYNREPLILFEEGNDYFTGKSLYYAIIRDLFDYGNSFVLINEMGGVIQNFIYLERHRVRVFTKVENGISQLYYVYTFKDGGERTFPARVVMHFKWGIDREEPLMGIPVIRGSIKEVANDTSLGLTSTNKANSGGGSDIIFSPEADSRSPRGELSLNSIKKVFHLWKSSAREGAGLPMFLPFSLKMFNKGYSPADLQISQQRNDLAHRIACPTGIDSMILGLPSDNRTYSNYKEAISNAVENAFLPLLDVIAATINSKLKVYTGKDTGGFRIHFDVTRIRGLQEGITARHERIRLDFRSNMIKLKDAQEELGYPVDSEYGDMYFSELVALGKIEEVPQDSGKGVNERSG